MRKPHCCASNPRQEDWQRVVAVFVQGPDWQFKQWDLSSFGGKMVNMFQRVCGFHLVFDKDQPHDNVKKFSIKLLSLSRNNRHLDNQVPAAAMAQEGRRGMCERNARGGGWGVVVGGGG